MSLFSTIQLANNTLQAMQIGLQVVGQNIANANTPGYIRERVLYEPAPVQRNGDLLLGLGVDVAGIVQQLDVFVLDRLRGAISDRASADVQEEIYIQLESIVGELSNTDLSSSLSNFFASISEILNQPSSIAVRNLAVLRGQALSSDLNSLSSRVQSVRRDVNERVLLLTDEVNALTTEIAGLNVQIAVTEGGKASTSDAGALRDRRIDALARLAEIADIRITEQQSGAVNVSIGGEFIVFENRRREVETSLSTDRGLSIATLQFADSQSPLVTRAGELTGLYEARDTILGEFMDELDEFTQTLIFEFNKAYSQGQGLSGFEELISEFAVDDDDLPLDEAGLPFAPVNGTLDILVFNTRSGLTSTRTILVDLNGLQEDTTLNDLVAEINSVDGITAAIATPGKLTIATDSPDSRFAFGNDTSGVLAAFGLNTFFAGTVAADISVNQVLVDDAGKFAASRGGIGEDTDNAIRLAAFADEPLASQKGVSLVGVYDQVTNQLTQSSSVASAVADGFRVFEATLEAKHQSITGVNLDEEAVQMIILQRIYQASARFIRTLSELLDALVNL